MDSSLLALQNQVTSLLQQRLAGREDGRGGRSQFQVDLQQEIQPARPLPGRDHPLGHHQSAERAQKDLSGDPRPRGPYPFGARAGLRGGRDPAGKRRERPSHVRRGPLGPAQSPGVGRGSLLAQDSGQLVFRTGAQILFPRAVTT